MVVVLVSVVLGACSTPSAEIVTPTSASTETPSPPLPTIAPAPYPTPDDMPKAIPSATSTPRPTGEEVTAEIVVRLCEYYRPIVEMWYDDFPIDPNIILALMAQESACNPTATDGVSVGLMQVTPKSWTLTEEWLWQPKWNIWQGMWMLYGNLTHETENPEQDMHRALAAYNCGWTSLNADKCLYFGGPVYADKVLYYWLPHFE